MTTQWVDVFEGPSWKAEIIKGELESAGIRTFVPDEDAHPLYPFVTGGDAFNLRVLVPEPDAIAAREIVTGAHERRERHGPPMSEP
jgi:hypothetical protein